MKETLILALGVLFLISPIRAGEIIPGVCWFDPPAELERSGENHDPGDSPFRMQSYSIRFAPRDNSPLGYRELLISTWLIGATIGEGKRVTINPVSDGELKTLMTSDVIYDRATNSPKVEDATLAGQKTLKVHNILPMPQVTPDGKTVFYHDTYWVRVRPNYVLDVHLIGASEAALATVHEWLASLKIQVSDKPDPEPPVKLGKDAAILGLTRTEVRKRCGDFAMQAPMDDTFLTPTLFIDVGFRDPDQQAASISYAKIADPQRVGSALLKRERRELSLLMLPMKPEEVQQILQRHTDNGKLTWAAAGPNRWKRSDGAMAAFIAGKSLTIATAELWPSLRFQE